MHDALTEPLVRGRPLCFVAAFLFLLVGLAWLAFGYRGGAVVAVPAFLAGIGLIALGCARARWPDDRQINYQMALAAVAGVALAVIVSPLLGWMGALVLMAGGGLGFLGVGWDALARQRVPRGVVHPRLGPALMARTATDALALGFFVNCAHTPRGEAVNVDRDEIRALGEIACRRGWDRHPAEAHRAPPAPGIPTLTRARAGRRTFEWLGFDSGFAPDPELPGAVRWMNHARNRRMCARVLHHDDEQPWLMCIHGYRMGMSSMDFQLFDIEHLHHELGLNIIMPILPLHGPRRATRLTGGLFLDGPLADLLHAEAQSLWDLRRCLAWIRADRPGARIGVLGYSLGGYNAALLAAFEPELACVIAGIPVADIPALLWRHMPWKRRRQLDAAGVSPAQMSALLAPVSPLHVAPVVASDRRFILAATADQMVPPEQPLRLWMHWQQPSIHWYHGSHLSVRSEPGIRSFIARALRATGLIEQERG